MIRPQTAGRPRGQQAARPVEGPPRKTVVGSVGSLIVSGVSGGPGSARTACNLHMKVDAEGWTCYLVEVLVLCFYVGGEGCDSVCVLFKLGTAFLTPLHVSYF